MNYRLTNFDETIEMLRDEVERWDPLGLAAAGLRGEYECLMGDLFSALKADATPHDVAALLEREFASHYGSAIFAAAFAARIVDRWRAIARKANT